MPNVCTNLISFRLHPVICQRYFHRPNTKKENLETSCHRYQKTDKLWIFSGSKLLMLLNALDLMVCLTAGIQLGMMVVYYKVPAVAHETFNSLYFIFLEATGFATCLLSTTRCISLCAPFYSVQGKAVGLAATLFISYTLVREVTLVRIVDRTIYLTNGLTKIHIGVLLGEIGLMIAVAMLANIICVVKILLKPDVAVRSRSAGVQATITVVILSGFFCVLNVFYLVTEALYFYFNVRLSDSPVLYFGIFYAVPLNSFANPLIYLLRKKEMRRYLMNPIKPLKSRKFTLGTPSPSMGTVLTRSTNSFGMASPALTQVLQRANTSWELNMSPCANRVRLPRSKSGLTLSRGTDAEKLTPNCV